MAKVAQARRALEEVERLREENADLRAQLAELQDSQGSPGTPDAGDGAAPPAKKTAPAKKAAPKPADN